MKVYFQTVVILCLLVLVGLAVMIAHDVHRLTNTVESLRGEVPMSGLGN